MWINYSVFMGKNAILKMNTKNSQKLLALTIDEC